MKHIMKLLTLLVFGIFLSLGFGCSEKNLQETVPGLAVYKTKGDYFRNAYCFMKPSGDIYMEPSFYNPRYQSIDPRIEITPSDTVYTLRVKLIDGYILGGEVGENMVFLDLTFKDYLNYEITHNTSSIPDSVLKEHILDDDPFLELYIDVNRPRKFELSDTALINQMIRNGELEKHFEKIK